MQLAHTNEGHHKHNTTTAHTTMIPIAHGHPNIDNVFTHMHIDKHLRHHDHTTNLVIHMTTPVFPYCHLRHVLLPFLILLYKIESIANLRACTPSASNAAPLIPTAPDTDALPSHIAQHGGEHKLARELGPHGGLGGLLSSLLH